MYTFSVYYTFLSNVPTYILLNIYDISCIVYTFAEVGAYCHNYANMYNTC